MLFYYSRTLTPQTKQDMAETMGSGFSTMGGIKHNPVDLLWKISTFRAGISNAISTEIPTAPVATSKRVFLERGSVNAGLKHIWIKHGLQFAQLCKVYNENQLQQYLYNVMSRGRKFIRAYKPIQGGGLKIVYQLPGLFLHVIMGDNGFIVTAYPTTKPEDYYGTRGYILNSQKPISDVFNKWKESKYDPLDQFSK